MFELFKRILNKHTDDPDILDIIEKEPEEWKEEWKAIHEKNKGLDSLTLNKFLEESPGREDLFLNRLRLKATASEMQAPKKKGKPILIWTFGLIVISLISLSIWFYPQKKIEQVIDYTLRVRGFSGNITLLRHKKKIELESGKYLLKADQFEIKNPEDSFTIQSSQYTIFTIQGPAFIELKEIPEQKGKISFYIHKGIISIDSKPAFNKPTVYWVTRNFTYTPLGTIAKLVVLNDRENLRVDKGSFSISNHETGITEVALAGTSIEKEVKKDEPEVSVSRAIQNESYGILQTITLKNGNKYTGYFYKSNGKVWIQTEKEKLELKEDEIETLE
jgi:hypothetical protein